MSILGRMKQVSIASGLYKPARAIHRMMMPAQRRQYNKITRLYSNFIQPGDLAFDIGANIGSRSEVMLKLGARVVAFEPQEDCAREIRARGNSGLEVICEAVGDEIGQKDFCLKSSTAIGSFLPDWAGDTSRVISVPVTTLDAAIKKFGKPDFCKIDVEGFEPQVIKGLSQPIKYISIEYETSERGISHIRSYAPKLLSFGPCEINITAHEENEFVFREWMGAEQFFQLFPLPARPAAYGDLFIRYVSPA